MVAEANTTAETNPAPAKWVMERLGLIESGLAREPLAPVSEATRKRIESLLAGSPHIDLPAAVA